MDTFLRNLITRHQVTDVNQNASYVVQPRPKSRFETDSAAVSEMTQQDPEIEPIRTSTSTQSSRSPLGAVQSEDFGELNKQHEWPPIARQPIGQEPPISDEQDSRIETILQRLDSPRPRLLNPY